ncbi:MAG: hypothetical protein RL701_3094 [Pseudomonadota bacterium]
MVMMRVAMASVTGLRSAELGGVCMVMVMRMAVIVLFRRSRGLALGCARVRVTVTAMDCAVLGLAVSGTHELQNGTVWASAQVPKQ